MSSLKEEIRECMVSAFFSAQVLALLWRALYTILNG